MKGCLHVVRGNEVKLTLPGPSVTQKADGTLWASGMPVLGIEDPAEKAKIAELSRAKKYSEIPAKYFTRLGDNLNGLWAGDDAAWAQHPARLAANIAETARAAERAKMVTIYLSSRGWGDYSACEWTGDITRPDVAILAECRNLLTNGYDIDQPNQSDDQLLALIKAAREKWQDAPALKAAKEKAEAEDINRKIETGYCFYCETWCDGDCGHYSRDPMIMHRRNFEQAGREQNYGIND